MNAVKVLWKKCPTGIRFFIIKLISCCIPRHDPSAGEDRIYVLGAFSSSSGLGESARLYACARIREGKSVQCLDITSQMMQTADYRQDVCTVIPFDRRGMLDGRGTVVIHTNPPQLQMALLRLGRNFLSNKRIVGYWAWEVEQFPSTWIDAIRNVDAIEVPSTFIQKSLAKYTSKPVSVVPHEIPQPPKRKDSFMADGILRCLYIFDLGSGYHRKNPEAVISAFARAFPNGEAVLTLKVSGGRAHGDRLKKLQSLCRGVKQVQIITDVLSKKALSSLYLENDIYLSLHRSEGYGLTIREAMLHGLHAVATGWSGNMDFMNGPLAHPVAYHLVPIDVADGPLKGIRGEWAEADIDDAAAILKHLYQMMVSEKQ